MYVEELGVFRGTMTEFALRRFRTSDPEACEEQNTTYAVTADMARQYKVPEIVRCHMFLTQTPKPLNPKPSSLNPDSPLPFHGQGGGSAKDLSWVSG